MVDSLASIIARVRAFEQEAHSILSLHETSTSRIVLLDDSYRELGSLSLRQDELFRQALRCLESKLFRAAHVMAWAGFIDYLEGKMTSDGLKKLQGARPQWRVKSVEDLRERFPEYQQIEACRDIGLCTKTEMKALLGLLNKRNECAHTSDYFPELNESLGFISELLRRIQALQPKTV